MLSCLGGWSTDIASWTAWALVSLTLTACDTHLDKFGSNRGKRCILVRSRPRAMSLRSSRRQYDRLPSEASQSTALGLVLLWIELRCTIEFETIIRTLLGLRLICCLHCTGVLLEALTAPHMPPHVIFLRHTFVPNALVRWK